SPAHSLSFFSHDTATTDIYTLSLHDALPICPARCSMANPVSVGSVRCRFPRRCRSLHFFFGSRVQIQKWSLDLNSVCGVQNETRSEEHTSELQSRENLVCRLLLEKKKKKEQQ